MLTFDVITLFPQLFDPHLKELPFKRALEKGLISVNFHNLRDFAVNAYGSVDDKPYGGGVGMILMIEPIYKTLLKVLQKDEKEEKIEKKPKLIILSPKGNLYTQQKARELAQIYGDGNSSNGEKNGQIILLCGRYEGIDARVEQLDQLIEKQLNIKLDVEMVSIGNFVLSGGEVAALAIMESVTRLIPGVLEKPEAIEIESFSLDSLGLSNPDTIEYPQYTRPEDFMGLKVPEVLLSGDHKKIEGWKKEHSQF